MARPGTLHYFQRRIMMRPAIRQLLLAGAALAVCSAAASTTHAPILPPAQEQQEPVIRFVKNPDPAPAFELPGLDGKPVTLENARGKVVLLNFWATWCGPCRAEIADLVDLQKRYSGKLEIIALATDEDDPDEVRRF